MSSLGVIGELNESKRLEWKIPNFSTLCKGVGSFYESPHFTFADTSLYFRVYPLPSGKNKISLSVYLIDETKHSCVVTISLQKSDGILIGTRTVANRTVANTTLSSHGFCNFFDASDLKKLLPADTLTISCDLKLDADGKQILPICEETCTLKEKQSTAKSQHMKLAEMDLLSKNLKELLINKDCCDVVLLVQGKEFKVHKNILIARSPVFAAMFRHDTVENQTGRITIPDCDADSFQKFLEYLYCGKLEDISFDNVLGLYRTSDKYDVLEVKSFCFKYLMRNLTVQNICDVVILANEYDDTALLSSVQDVFNKNLQEILMTSEWENLFKESFCLANKLLIEMSKTERMVLGDVSSVECLPVTDKNLS